MPLNLPNFGMQPINWLDQYNKGLISQADNRRKQLENALLESQAKYAEPLAQANISHLMQRAEPSLSEFGKMLREREQASAMYGQDSAQVKLFDALLQRKAEGSAGQQFTVSPDGTVSFSQGGRPGGAGGWRLDANGNVVQDLTTPVKTSIQTQQLGRASREVLDAIKQPYIGRGASKELTNDLLAYGKIKDPAKKAALGEKLIEAALAAKTLPDKVFDQLASQGITPTVSAIEHQNKAASQGWADAYSLLLDNLPSDLQQEVERRYNEVLDRVGDAREQKAIRNAPIKPKSIEKYNKTDLEHTAKKYGMTVEQLLLELED